MRLPKLKDWLLPIYLLAFAGSAVSFLTPVFNITTRWIVLAFVVAYLLFNGKLTRPLRTSFGLLTLVFALWALATGTWSEVAQLSYLKAFAFLLISFAGLASGQAWVRQNAQQDGLNFLGPLTVVTLLAGLLGQATGQGYASVGDLATSQGMTGNSNMFGSLLAMCSPFLAWQTFCSWGHKRKRALWLLLAGVGLHYLLASTSRAAILIVLCTLLGLFLALGQSRKVFILLVVGGVIASVFVFAPQQVEQISNRFIYKGQATEQGATYSRDEVWRESYELAVEGGWTGSGYGVTIGDSNFQGALTAVGYGREKGNSQFAIAEETGLVGLAIYLISVVFLVARLGRVVVRLPRGPHKTMLGIVTGTLVGMLVQSMFEAWWVAPASPESAYFWVLAGVALALAEVRRPVAAPHVKLSHRSGTSHIAFRDHLR